MRCTIIGLGEAGRIYAEALTAGGHSVTGYDPAPVDSPGIKRAPTMEEAVRDAEAVFVMTTARAAIPVARDAAPYVPEQVLYADFTSAAPATKRAVEQALPPRTRTADIAILGPVIALGIKTPLMAAGPGATAIADVLAPLGAPVEVLDAGVGEAMAHKLLRSIVMKGMAAVIVEAVEAGRLAGHEEWVRAQIAAELAGEGQKTIDRFLSGSVKHAARRAEEMAAVTEFCSMLGAPTDMSSATRTSLLRLTETTNAA